MKLNYSRILQDIEKKPSPVYLFSGKENFLKEEFLKQVLSTIPPELAGFNCDIFYGGENSGGEIIAQAIAFPFGASRRMVVVKSAELLKEKDMEDILSYLENPSGNTVLILLADIKNSKTGFFSRVSKKGREIDFRSMYRNEIIPWLRNRAKASGKELSPRAAYELKERSGGNLRTLANELEKLYALTGERKKIEVEDVDISAGKSRIRTGFEFVDAIGKKKKSDALNILFSLMQQGEPALKIIGLLAWQFRRIWKVKICMENGMQLQDISKAANMPLFVVKELTGQAKRFSQDKLKDSFSALLETDIKIKSTAPSKLTLELLVIRLSN